MFGDIHRFQYLDKNQTKAYCGSLIAQDVSEGDDNFHGYLLWDVKTKTFEAIPVFNNYSYKNIRITPYTDFNDLDFEIDNPTKYMRIRFIWGSLLSARNKDNERKLYEYIRTKYKTSTILTFAHKNEFVENEKIEVNENVTLENITNKAVQHEIFKDYFTKIGVDETTINDILALDEEILKEIDVVDEESIEWNIVKFGATNFMSYGQLDIDWRDKDGLFQITGINTAGKTTIMKLISYILFSKTLETETRMKYGDQRFVNNRNGATFCEAYLVIEANGEYYGIKKRTEITKTRSGEINGAPTTLNYYLLTTSDDEMTDDKLVEKLDEDRRIKTQKKVNLIIGSYDNFMRIVMTTSDTLNRILSNEMAEFIDSLLFDSGLDIFDKKLEGLKAYQKRVNELSRVNCNVEITTQQNATLTQEIATLEGEITEIETVKLPDIQGRITKGREYVETLTKKLFKIDPEIYNLDVDKTKEDIGVHQKEIDDLNARKGVIEQNIKPLKETYDAEKLKSLLEKKDAHRTAEFNKKLDIKSLNQDIRDEEHKIEIINGDVVRLKQDGAKLKKEIGDLKNSKVCSQCGQAINKPEHLEHIEKTVKEKEGEMFKIADKINIKETVDKKECQRVIDKKKIEVDSIEKTIEESATAMEIVLKEIGELTNDKNDVEKRKELQTELDQIPTKVKVEELQIAALQQKLINQRNLYIGSR